MSASVTVHKLDAQGREVWTYDGIVLERGSHFLILQAFFDRQDADLCGLALHRGDRFVETFYDDRWYNVFAVHDRDTDEHKGWYCNITRPALLTDYAVKAEDLALDLVVNLKDSGLTTSSGGRPGMPSWSSGSWRPSARGLFERGILNEGFAPAFEGGGEDQEQSARQIRLATGRRRGARVRTTNRRSSTRRSQRC
jgi:hypothetical protein